MCAYTELFLKLHLKYIGRTPYVEREIHFVHIGQPAKHFHSKKIKHFFINQYSNHQYLR